MTKSSKTVSKAQGAPDTNQVTDEALKTVTVEQVQKWIERDLGAAISLLMSIQGDKTITEQVAIFLHGKFSNQKEREKAEASAVIEAQKLQPQA